MAGVDYLAMVSDPEELLSVARSIDGQKVAQLLGQYQRMTQTMTEAGEFGHDVDGAAASQLFGTFVDEAHHESTVLSYAALNIADTCNRMRAKLSNFYEQYMEKVQPAAQTLQQVYDAQLGHGAASSPAELRTASTALAKALGQLYTDLAGNPTINVAPAFAEAAIPDIGADGRRSEGGQRSADSRTGQNAPDARRTVSSGGQQDGVGTAASQAAPVAGPSSSPAQAGGGPAGAAEASGGGAASPVGSGGAVGGKPVSSSQSGAGTSSSRQGGPADSAGGALAALGQLGSTLGSVGSGLAGAAGSGAGLASAGAGIAMGATGLGASLGGLAAQPAAADGAAEDAFTDSDGDVGGALGDTTPAATKPAGDFGGGSGGTAAHVLAEPGSARVGTPPEVRLTPAAAGLSAESAVVGTSAAPSSGMMGMPMMGAAGMNGGSGEHRVANYLISKEQGERQFTASLPLASEEILGDLDERERLAMQIASIDEPSGEVR
ncbi:hypothetical protein [Segniliparus rugosus]|uniref:Uncharacterized protein n=1 Tax=Segniliparus rugosus (strain ATCC BAA-974 / DSM 45345 / CCUG 50838 / CIP 108380 / JCM 13579 / CDC 945) TaxID=679197 RepID=U1M2F8_SEGRC|nr:hypothetical protein [Segniliparus rugosus]ERG69285.1 hypothetical protein HMPREF9336_04176 [Segniliparus rugosus ATCC BAA-974]